MNQPNRDTLILDELAHWIDRAQWSEAAHELRDDQLRELRRERDEYKAENDRLTNELDKLTAEVKRYRKGRK